MGREIRKVPAGWVHPFREDRPEQHQPLHDENYEDAVAEWFENHKLWLNKEHPDQLKSEPPDYKYYAEWGGNPPDFEYYRTYKDEVCTHFQMYETVSEGTPCTPVFASLQELEDYLVSTGECAGTQYERKFSRAAAHGFCQSGYAPSMVFTSQHGLKDGVSSYEDK
jgi:hypothetical protein